jgi:tetratricopeptide (TPR) repeat protein
MTYFVALLALWMQTTARPADLDSLVDRLGRATVTGDVDALTEIRDSLEEGLGGEESSDREIHLYTLAYVNWRLAYLPGHEKISERAELLRNAESHLKALLGTQPDNAEALALLGAVYGGQITTTWQKFSIGNKAQEALRRAAKLDPDNPRVVLNRAVATFYKPRLLGGGKNKALKELRRAEELFEQEAPDQTWPNWGRVEVQTWIGWVLAQKGDREGARQAYQRALVLAPGHSRVLNTLLPELDSEGDGR